MSAYWAEYVQLPEGLARRVRFEVTETRFGTVRVGADPQPSD